jgi:protein-disulfide isomerase
VASRVNAKQERQRAAAAAAAKAAKEQRARTTRIVAGVVVLVLVVVGGIWWQVQRSTVDDVADPGPQVASELLDDGVAIGDADKPVVDIYLDFLCPHCAEMEQRIGAAIGAMAEEGEAQVVIHPITLIDPAESARSAAAFGCAGGTTKELGFQKALFDNAAGGFSTDRLVEIGASVGLTDPAFVQCVKNDDKADWATAVNTAATQAGVKGTPTIFVDGNPMNLDATQTPVGFRLEVGKLQNN